MKSTRATIIIALFFLVLGCSDDDDNNTINGPTIAEQLISGIPWNFSEFVIDAVTNAGGSMLTESQVETLINAQFASLSLDFDSGGTGQLSSTELTSAITWSLDANNNLSISITALADPDNEANFTNLRFQNSQLLGDTMVSVYDEVAEVDVETEGTFYFD